MMERIRNINKVDLKKDDAVSVNDVVERYPAFSCPVIVSYSHNLNV